VRWRCDDACRLRAHREHRPGLGAIATALLGPLALGWIDYHVSSGAVDQLRGGDLAGLVLVGPVALAAAWRVATRRPRADALALAPAPDRRPPPSSFS